MRLIDADALVEFLLKEIIECDEEYDKYSDHIILGARQEAELIRDKVKEMPTVDIVRCKDCKYWNKHHFIDIYVCSIHNKEGQYPYLLFEMNADDFCSRGERAE